MLKSQNENKYILTDKGSYASILIYKLFILHNLLDRKKQRLRKVVKTKIITKIWNVLLYKTICEKNAKKNVLTNSIKCEVKWERSTSYYNISDYSSWIINSRYRCK